MKRMLLVCALVGTMLVPAALAADPVPADFQNAAKYCKAVRDFEGRRGVPVTAYGTNKNKKNAFGKCVSQTGRRRRPPSARTPRRTTTTRPSRRSAADCKKQQAADAAKFAKDYKNFGQCVKAGNAKNGDDEDED